MLATTPTALPPTAGRWSLDTRTADVAFTGRASRLAPPVSARFRGVSGVVAAGDHPDDVVVDVEVDVRTMTSGNRAWDDLVAAVDPFCVRRFPTARYRSTRVVRPGGTAVLDGVLTLRGVHQPLQLTVRRVAHRGDDRLVVSACGEIDREAFGVRLDLPGARLLVPRRLQLSIDVVAVHERAA
jgi:polyisoprenoid-binding protein YceI